MSMEKLLVKKEQPEWYKELLRKIKSILNDMSIKTTYYMLEAKYKIGKEILSNYKNFNRYERSNITQIQLGIDLGISQPQISRMKIFAQDIIKNYHSNFEEWFTYHSKGLPSWRKVISELTQKRIDLKIKPNRLELLEIEVKDIDNSILEDIENLLNGVIETFATFNFRKKLREQLKELSTDIKFIRTKVRKING